MNDTWEDFKRRKRREFGKAGPATVAARVDAPRYAEFAGAAPMKPTPSQAMSGPRFNVHKRSLPVGQPPLDKIVFFNVSPEEAEILATRFLRTRCYDDEVRRTKTVIYYDIVPVGAQPRERSIYYNPRPFSVAEGSKPEKTIVIQTDENQWIG